MDKIISVVGSTGTGKSDLAVRLAKVFNGEVISADSMQVYRNMDIGTAKITPEEMDGVPHHLIDIQPFDEPYNVKIFQDKSREAIQDILSRGKLPILCGGTGLYTKAAVYDYEFSQEEEDPKLRAELESLSNEELVERLKREDPSALDKIHPNNRKRLIRALMMSATGDLKTDREARQKHAPLYDVFFIGLCADRSLVDQRIEKRVDRMFDAGLVEEAERLFSDPKTWSYTSFQGIGYKEFQGYFEGTKSLEQVKNEIVIHSRQYAKRQMTWFRHQMNVTWFDLEHPQAIEQAVKEWLENGTERKDEDSASAE